MRKYRFIVLSSIIAAGLLTACSTNDDGFSWSTPELPDDGGNTNVSGGSSSSSSSITPDFNAVITAYDGTKATDASRDVVGDDADFYWEANSFSTTVKVVYDGNKATVESSSNKVITNVDGAYVTVDMLTNSVKNVEIIVSGTSDDGGLKIYGEKKFKLTLNGVSLKSTKGPAINNQCKKRMFVHLSDGTNNTLEDAGTYTADSYYISGSSESAEDRKGCFFSEANMLFSGSGVLSVTGNYKHAIVTDGYFWMRPGVTLVVPSAAKNAIHVKGDSDDAIGVTINGGYIYANVSSEAGKCIKTDLNVDIKGGVLSLNTSGGAVYDTDDKDTSSAAGIKADGDINISGGTITCKSTGRGGKGLSSDGNLVIDGGDITIATSGTVYTYSKNLTSSPKGIRSDGNITINGGNIRVAVTGVSDGSEGIESKAKLTVNDGSIYVYAYDDAINAATDITVNGGKIFAYAINNDGIDSNGTININGGVILSSGTSSPEEGIDADNSNYFKINGGTVIGLGGSAATPSTSSKQRSVVINSISSSANNILSLVDASNNPLITFAMPRTYNTMCVLLSSSKITSASYKLQSGVTISNNSDSWYGYYSDGAVAGGSTLASFTSSSTVTTVGQSSGMGGGGFGGFGGGGWH
jgi:hypothetical protein